MAHCQRIVPVLNLMQFTTVTQGTDGNELPLQGLVLVLESTCYEVSC